MQIGDVSTIPEAVKREVRARRYLYWTMLGRYLLFHVWSLAVASTLLWAFDATRESTLLFLAYIFAYTGLLWYQVRYLYHFNFIPNVLNSIPKYFPALEV